MPTAGIAPVPSDAPVGQAKKGAAESVATIPFARSSKWHIEQSNTQSGITLAANSQVFNYPIASYGYLSALFITVQLSGSGSATTATYNEDAPYSLLSQVQVSDVNGVPIFQMSGFHAYLAAKYGGYRLFGVDSMPRGAPFDTTTNAPIGAPLVNQLGGGPAAAVGASPFVTGNFGAWLQMPTATSLNTKFVLPIFFEFGVDGLGCLPNMDASARYNLQITVAGGAGVNGGNPSPYLATGTAPGTLPTMAITVEALCRSQPPASDMFGNRNSSAPPSVGTVQYWTSQTASGLSTGANTIQLTRVGNLIRNHIFVFRSTGLANGTQNQRANAETTDMPSLFEFDWDTGQRFVAQTSTLRQLFMYGVSGYDVPNGVIALPNTLDPDKIIISEYGDEWLGTVGATKFTIRFSPGGTGTGGSMTILTNDIVPASGQVYQAPQLLVG